ncbi:hypothetical protein MRX96_017285 [Rhipicephalus microplus]
MTPRPRRHLFHGRPQHPLPEFDGLRYADYSQPLFGLPSTFPWTPGPTLPTEPSLAVRLRPAAIHSSRVVHLVATVEGSSNFLRGGSQPRPTRATSDKPACHQERHPSASSGDGGSQVPRVPLIS